MREKKTEIKFHENKIAAHDKFLRVSPPSENNTLSQVSVASSVVRECCLSWNNSATKLLTHRLLFRDFAPRRLIREKK